MRAAIPRPIDMMELCLEVIDSRGRSLFRQSHRLRAERLRAGWRSRLVIAIPGNQGPTALAALLDTDRRRHGRPVPIQGRSNTLSHDQDEPPGPLRKPSVFRTLVADSCPCDGICRRRARRGHADRALGAPSFDDRVAAFKALERLGAAALPAPRAAADSNDMRVRSRVRALIDSVGRNVETERFATDLLTPRLSEPSAGRGCHCPQRPSRPGIGFADPAPIRDTE